MRRSPARRGVRAGATAGIGTSVAVGIAVLVVGLLLSGCAVGPSQRPPVATRQTAVGSVPDFPTPPAPPPASPLPPLLPATPAVRFDECTATASRAVGGPAAFGGRDLRLGCATVPVAGSETTPSGVVGVLRVTLGPAPPSPTVPLAVLSDPTSAGVGTAEAIRLAAGVPETLLSGAAFYGIDVRGSGESEPVDCITPTTRITLDDVDPAAADAAAFAPVLRAAQSAARTCSQILEEAVTGYRTAAAAEDLERVRRALGAPRLNVVALGQGAGVVAAWSERFPDGVGRTVLDALPDPTAPTLVRAEQSGEAARAALTAFATDCVARPGCPLGPDPAQAVAGIVLNLRAAPLAGTDGRLVGPGTLVTALVDGLSDPTTWTATATAVAAAGQGNPAPVLGMVDAQEADGAGFDLGLMTRCNDSSERLTVDQVVPVAARATDPVFGSWFVQQTLACSSWPVPTEPLAAPTQSGAPPLLLASAADPRSPAAGTQRVAAQLDGATLVSWLGTGHGSFPRTACITTAVEGYLVRAALPRVGTVCPP